MYGSPTLATYSVSKFAVRALTEEDVAKRAQLVVEKRPLHDRVTTPSNCCH